MGRRLKMEKFRDFVRLIAILHYFTTITYNLTCVGVCCIPVSDKFLHKDSHTGPQISIMMNFHESSANAGTSVSDVKYK